MFGFKKKVKKDPICGMEDNGKFKSKYGEKFCSDTCIMKFEQENKIAGHNSKKSGGSCCG